MNHLNTRKLAVSILVLGVALASGKPACAQVISQGIGQRTLVVAKDRKVYLVDFSMGSAAPLPLAVDSEMSLSMSPDQNYLAVSGSNGIIVYQVSGASISQLAQVTSSAAYGMAWSQDGKSLSYVQEIKNPDGSSSIQIHLWDKETRQTKRLI